jgi:hypothetical protein
MNQNVISFFLFIFLIILNGSFAYEKLFYTNDEIDTTYDFYLKYNKPENGPNNKVIKIDDRKIKDHEFPNEGSFLSNTLSFNKTLPKFDVHMAVILGNPALKEPSDLVLGKFDITKDDLVDYFNQYWSDKKHEIREKELKTINDISDKLKSLYIDKHSLITGKNTTEMVFISDTPEYTKLYTEALIKTVYKDYDNKILLVKDRIFSLEAFNNSIWNKEGYQPLASFLDEEMTTAYFGFGTAYNCKKFSNWLTFARKDSYLTQTYANLFEDVHTVLIEAFKDNNKFYRENGDLFLDLSENNIRYNLTLGFILSKTLYTDAVLFGIPNLDKFLTPKILESFLRMHNFLKYEYFLYSDLHSYMIISPFIEFAMNEFNFKIKNILDPIANPGNPRKIVWFTGHENNISALFKILNYDYKIIQNGFLSVKNTWQMIQEIKNDFAYFPYVGYGYAVSFELLSYYDEKNKKRYFYIGLRENFKQEYLFLISLRSFNKLGKLILMKPSYSNIERANFCN